MSYKDRVRRAKERAVMLRRIDKGCVIGLMALGSLVAQRAELNAPVDTGRLARSIHRGPPFRIGPFVWGAQVGTNVEYARAQEMGSGLYSEDPKYRKKIKIVAGFYNPETPSNKRALSFAWPGGPDPHPALQTEGPYAGKYAFASVMHPGVKPQPYLRPALQSVREDGSERRLIIGSIVAEVTR